MEAASKIGDSIAKALRGHEHVQSDDVATLHAAGMAAEMSINEIHAERWLAFVTTFMAWAANLRPLVARLAYEQTTFGQIAQWCRQRSTIHLAASRHVGEVPLSATAE